MPLRKADVTQTRRFEDGDDWLVIRTQLTKSEADAVSDASSALKAGMSGVEVVQQTAQANRVLFDILAVDWSLSGDPTGAAYAELDDESGQWIDECIAEVLKERRERAEKNAGTSAKPKRRAGSSATVAASR